MERLVVAVAIIAVVALVATVARRRRTPDAPTQRHHQVPTQLDRDDFDRPDAAWLVAVFTSATCEVCHSVRDKAFVLASEDVAVQEVEYRAARALHERYVIDAVPMVVIADSRGVTVASFVGAMTATDLWAAMAEAREPGSTPRSDSCSRPE